jgi:hypothetical protein
MTDRDASPTTEEEVIKAQHPGFTILCDRCGSKRVTVENSLGFSAASGAWGEIALVCQDCHATTDIFTP